ncbi:MAG: hypothetical protein HKN77_07210 [Woeseiaceae bacterium]|nr:hypothetical protein [Woeseiaceae bacterium]
MPLSMLFICTPSLADPGLGSLEGLWIVYLVGLIFLVIAALVGGLILHAGFRLMKSDDKSDVRSGRFILGLLAIFGIAMSTLFTDFSLYFLRDNTFPDAVTISRAHVERYMETDDGRAFFLTEDARRYFKPGRSVVLRPDSSGAMRVHDIDKFSRSTYHRLSEKKLWLPLIPTVRDRNVLLDRGPAMRLEKNWRFDDLIASGDGHLPWCCEVEWARMLLARGADPNRAHGRRLPLTKAVAPLGWHSNADEIAEIEAVLATLLAAGADVNAIDDDGNTVLHQLIHHPLIEPITWILAHGADPSIANNKGQTPLDLLQAQKKRLGSYWDEKALAKHNSFVDLLNRATVQSKPQ